MAANRRPRRSTRQGTRWSSPQREEVGRMTSNGPDPSAELREQVAALTRELAEARQQGAEGLAREVATSEILRVIAGSPTDLQPVLDAVVENAANLCGGSGAIIYRVQDRVLRVAASCGFLRGLAVGEERPLTRGSVVGRAILGRETVHVH